MRGRESRRRRRKKKKKEEERRREVEMQNWRRSRWVRTSERASEVGQIEA
jgi:hypothetical protein